MQDTTLDNHFRLVTSAPSPIDDESVSARPQDTARDLKGR